MTTVLLKALDRLTDPLAIITIVLVGVVVLLVRNLTRHLPELNRTLGRQISILEYLVYQHDNKIDQDEQPN